MKPGMRFVAEMLKLRGELNKKTWIKLENCLLLPKIDVLFECKLFSLTFKPLIDRILLQVFLDIICHLAFCMLDF